MRFSVVAGNTSTSEFFVAFTAVEYPEAMDEQSRFVQASEAAATEAPRTVAVRIRPERGCVPRRAGSAAARPNIGSC